MPKTKLLDILACPACKGGLIYEERADQSKGFLCPHCETIYPIEDEIPIMLIDKAIPANDWRKGENKR